MKFFANLTSSFKLVFEVFKTGNFWKLAGVGVAIQLVAYLFTVMLIYAYAPASFLASDDVDSPVALFQENLPFALIILALNLAVGIFFFPFFSMLPFLISMLKLKRLKALELGLPIFFKYVWLLVKVFLFSILTIPSKMLGYAYLGFVGLIAFFLGLAVVFSNDVLSPAGFGAATGAFVMLLVLAFFAFVYNGIRYSFSILNLFVGEKKPLAASWLQTSGKFFSILLQLSVPTLVFTLFISLIFGIPQFVLSKLVASKIIGMPEIALFFVNGVFSSSADVLSIFAAIVVVVNVFHHYKK